MNQHPFALFLQEFEPRLEKKSNQLRKAEWILETTGSVDAADLKADLDVELRLMFHDPDIYQKLLVWDKDPEIKDPLLKRQLNVLIRSFKESQVPEELLEAIAKEEAELARTYANFRPKLDGKALSENELREILKTENNPAQRKKAWEASKEIGLVLAPQILSLVALRNRAAKHLGYCDYFEMQLDLQEVERPWLLALLDDLAQRSDEAYSRMLEKIVARLSERFGVASTAFGPWAWGDPFCQEDPLDTQSIDKLIVGVDIVSACKRYYEAMGFDVNAILEKSDLYERPGKNQHAFCTHIDRRGDIRTLNNIAPSIKWLETVLHELGHAIYETGFDPSLPWLLCQPPHMIPTEAMALIAGRQAYRKEALPALVGEGKEDLISLADESLERRQLIFSRWVMTMTKFESELYRDPSQDLNALWWHLVEQYQKIPAPPDRTGKADWAAKYHIGLAPVYYFSYLLGELFASAIQEALFQEVGTGNLDSQPTGNFLRNRLFAPGNRWKWSELVHAVCGKELTPDAWLREFC